MSLEDNLQRKLNLPRTCNCARRAGAGENLSRATEEAFGLARSVRKRTVKDCPCRDSKVRMVQDIKELRPEFQVAALTQILERRVLNDGEIDTAQVRAP